MALYSQLPHRYGIQEEDLYQIHELYSAAWNGDTAEVVALLERGVNVNATHTISDGQTALHISSKNGHTYTVVALLERGADINARDKMHHTPLDLARQHGHRTVVKLIENTAVKKAELWAASRDGDTNRVLSLLDTCKGISVNTCDEDGQTALHISSENGHTDTVVALLERGADINARDEMYHTPLDLARRHGHGTVVEVLKSKAMQIAELWAASRDGDTNRVLSLLDTCKGINVNTRDEVCKHTHNIQAEVSTCLLLPGMLSNPADPFEALSRLALALRHFEFKLM